MAVLGRKISSKNEFVPSGTVPDIENRGRVISVKMNRRSEGEICTKIGMIGMYKFIIMTCLCVILLFDISPQVSVFSRWLFFHLEFCYI